MCKEDVRFMRRTKWNSKSYAPGGAFTGLVLLPPNADRVALVVAALPPANPGLYPSMLLYTKDGGNKVVIGAVGQTGMCQILLTDIGQVMTGEILADDYSAVDSYVLIITEIVLADELERL